MHSHTRKDEADRICCFNRESAEKKGTFERQALFKQEFDEVTDVLDFHDSITGKLLFSAPKYRTK